MKKVEFKNQTFGIRRRSWLGFYEYKDLSRSPYWWPRTSAWYVECQTNDSNKMNKVWDQLTDVGMPL